MGKVIDIKQMEQQALAHGGALLLNGELVAIPTETVYGLAADATNPDAIAKIYAVKGRPALNPLICHMADLTMAKQYAQFSPLAVQIAQAFWPGPLTLVLPLKPQTSLASTAMAGLPTIGVRVPTGFASKLIASIQRPLAAPSANTSGKISPTTAAHVKADLGNRLPLIVDGGPALVGVESTILKIIDDRIILLRPGGVSASAVEDLTGKAVYRPSLQTTVEAPGMMASHYAPNADVRLNARRAEHGEALITFGNSPIENIEAAHVVFQLSKTGSLIEAASRLYDLMKQADAASVRTIAFSPIPGTGIGEAINDRLRRAAAPRPNGIGDLK